MTKKPARDLGHPALLARLARGGWRPAPPPLGGLYWTHVTEPTRHVPGVVDRQGKVRGRATLAKLLRIHGGAVTP